MLVFSVVIISRLSIIILRPTYFMPMNKACFGHYCDIFSNIYQNNNKRGAGFPSTSGQIPPTFGYSDWLTRDPPVAYTARNYTTIMTRCLIES